MGKTEKRLFSVAQAAKVCGVSRSTLLRLEERGLLKPANVAFASRRRHYDTHNVYRILQIQKMQAMGFDAREIGTYFAQQGDASELLGILERKLDEITVSVEEMRLRAGGGEAMSVSIIKLPEVVCCVRRSNGGTVMDKYNAMYSFCTECIEKGYVLDRAPLFVILERADYIDGYISDKPHDYFVCVPVRPETAPNNAVKFSGCRALSVLFYGNYRRVDEAWLRLGREAEERGLTPVAYPCSIGFTAPYTGREISHEHYCTRLAMPIAD